MLIENEVETETQTDDTPETSLREDLEASFAELTAEETPAEPESTEAAEPPAAPREDGRDEKGRFAPKKAAGPAGAAEPVAGERPGEAAPAAAPAPPVPPQEAAPAPAAEPVERAPQSWKPGAREHWTKLPAEVRAEVQRREQETSRVLQESAQARRGYSEFQEAVRPYEAMIRAEAGDPVRAVQGLLQTAFALRTAPPAQKAQIVAQLIQGYQVPVDALDAVLSGQQPGPQAQQAAPYDPRVDQLFSRLEQAEQARKQALMESARSQYEEFAGQHEFFEDVREDVADILEMTGRRGQKVTLAQAYERAVALNPELQQIIKQREAAKRAGPAQAQVQRAKAAASSVRSAPAVAPKRTRENTSLREDLEESLRELSGR